MAVAEEPYAQPKSEKGWFGRNWWWVLIVVVGGGFVGCCGICGGFAFVGIKAMKESPPYTMTMAAVRSDPTVIERLGEPIEDTWMIEMQGDFQGSDGTVMITIPTITGPKGTATVQSEARAVNGQWGLTSLAVTFSDGERHVIDVAGGSAAKGDDTGAAPAWTPESETAPTETP